MSSTIGVSDVIVNRNVSNKSADQIVRIAENRPEIPIFPESELQEIRARGKNLENKVFGMLDRSESIYRKIPNFFESKHCKILFSELDKINQRGYWLLNHPDFAKKLSSEEMDDFIKGKKSKFSLNHKKLYSYVSRILKYIHI